MTVYQLGKELVFPSVKDAEPDGLLAFGGDLSQDRVLLAYKRGLFPWFSEGDPILWWSPDPRLVLYPEQFKISNSLGRIIRSNKFHIQYDTHFEEVVDKCKIVARKGQEGTWITKIMKEAYSSLHHAGYAHSVEAFLEGKLVGGLYGVSIGSCFFGESMYSEVPNASKVALSYLVSLLKSWNHKMIDCQVTTGHLLSLGAIEIPRNEFIKQLNLCLKDKTRIGNWKESING